MMPRTCPRCGTTLIKETTEVVPTSNSRGSGSLYPDKAPSSNIYEGSISVFPRLVHDVYRCPECGYLFIDW